MQHSDDKKVVRISVNSNTQITHNRLRQTPYDRLSKLADSAGVFKVVQEVFSGLLGLDKSMQV